MSWIFPGAYLFTCHDIDGQLSFNYAIWVLEITTDDVVIDHGSRVVLCCSNQTRNESVNYLFTLHVFLY